MAVDITNRESVLSNITGADDTARKKYDDASAKMRAGLDALLGANPSKSTAKIRDYGGKVADIAGEVKPLASDVKSLGGELANIGRGINEQGAALLGTGNDILNMNRGSSNPLVQALLGLYDSYSPGLYASIAGQDVANQYDVARGQQNRSLSRQGVNPSSGRYVSLDQLVDTAQATAKAAAMTRARNLGLDRQAAFLTDTLGGLGRQLVSQGTSTQAQGANVIGNAVGADQTAAGILSNAASIFSNAASLEGSAANIDLGFAKEVMGQENAMANLDVATANYYSNLMSELMQFQTQQDRIAAQMRANSAPGSVSSYEDIHGNKILWSGNGWQSFAKTDSGYVPLGK